MSARVLVVTGTDTEVGKTVVTAALVSRALDAGLRVHLHKATQTGVAPGEEGDVQTVQCLLGDPSELEVSEGVRLPEPLAPATAARRAGVTAPTVAEHVARVVALAADPGNDLVVVEGAGGLLVEADAEGGTLRDLVRQLVEADVEAGADVGGVAVETVVVARAGLGTLNHAALTVEALGDLPVAGLVVGAASTDPDLAERCNRRDLPRVTGRPVLGEVPAGAGALDPVAFRQGAREWVRLP
ncbi:dethiobiotin synthase [Kytococcus sp. Marseille-QA3725]